MQGLKISREGVILIKSFEGFRPRAIRRDDGQWAIGYGHTASAREGASVSEADAELLLQYDLIPIAKALNGSVAPRLNQHQFDALASFAFSVGLDHFHGSNVLSRLNAGFAGEAADALVGWSEPVLLETSVRRRAAERALFVADPAWPVALADLLVAPLPPPAVAAPEPAIEPAMSDEGVRPISEDKGLSAVAGADDDVPATTDEAEPAPETAEPAAPFAPVAATFNYPSAQTRQRYSAYPGVIVGPLPAAMLAAPVPSPAENEPLEVFTETAPEITAQEASVPTPVANEPVLTASALSASAPPALETVAGSFDPAPAQAIAETDVLLPRFGVSAEEHNVARPTFPASTFPAPSFPAPTPPAPVWPAITAASEPRTDGELLVLTSPADSDVFALPRPVWPHDDQASGDATPLFEDDGTMRAAPGNIIRHEPQEDVAPAGIPWGELGAYGLMGAFGLVSFGMSMAAFRRASQAASDADGTTVIAIVLAVIGAACVGVSAYNLYRRWGRAEED